jgi:hypothetical protein
MESTLCMGSQPSLGVNGLFDLLAEKGYNGRVKSGFIALDLAYWRMR